MEKDVGVMFEDTLKPSMQCAAAAAKVNRFFGQHFRAVQWRDKITILKLFILQSCMQCLYWMIMQGQCSARTWWGTVRPWRRSRRGWSA